MAVIHILEKHTAELIAAGEVVERPASVVKELTENAIDAGAHSITVAVEHGGIACIRIADDGTGIDAEYIPTAFVRHATSKIRTQDDLENIHTLGFRGEALASVASVARVELLTRTEADEFACLYRISGGEEEGLTADARPVGTTITVRDLFYNTPARMKFLKKDVSEANYVSDVMTQLALSHPEVAFKFIREDKVQFQTPGDGKLRGAVYAALSREFAQDLIDVDYTEDAYRVSGCVTPPKSGRASRAMQFFFLNGRFVKNRTMMAALEAAYKGTLMQGKYPGCVLSLTMPTQLVDVNVHPAKTEVRFAREKDVFDRVYQAVKSVLLSPQNTERAFLFAPQATQGTAAAQIGDVPTETQKYDKLPAPHFAGDGEANPLPWEIPRSKIPAQAQPVRAQAVQNYAGMGIAPTPQQVRAYNGLVETLAGEPVVPYRTETAADAADTATTANASLPQPIQQHMQLDAEAAGEARQCQPSLPGEALRFVGEVFNTYIVTQSGDDLCFIDKHAAHERILYEELLANYGSVDSQMLLCPVTVQLSAEEKNALLEHKAILEDSGLETDDFGANAVVVRAVPANIVPGDVADLVVELASRLVTNPRETTSEKTQWVLHSIACRGAVKAGDKTHAAHLLRLAQDVLDGKVPPFCPHGRPVVLRISKKELEKQFGRQG